MGVADLTSIQAQIDAQIDALQVEINAENQRGMLRDSGKVSELELQVTQLEASLEAQTQAEVNTEVAKFMETLDFEGVNPKDLFLNYSEDGAESSYNYVNAVIQNAVAKMKQADLANTKTLEAKLAALQEKYDQSEAANEQLNIELSNKSLEIADLNSKLANATRMLDEEKAETARLSSQVDDLRKEIALGAAAAIKVEEVNVRSAHEKWLEQRRKEEEAKPAIYNIRWKDDIRRDSYLAELASTDETIEIPYFAMTGDMSNGGTSMKGKYRVVTSEEAPSFRIEPAQETTVDTSSTGVLEVEEQPVTVPAFQEEEYTYCIPAVGLVEENASLEVAGTTVTREEFTALVARVEAIEAKQGNGTVAA